MDTQNEPGDGSSGRGFAGLTTLLSDEDTIVDGAPSAREPTTSSLDQPAKCQSAQAASMSVPPQPKLGAGKPVDSAISALSAKKASSQTFWLLGIGAVIFVGVLASLKDNPNNGTTATQSQWENASAGTTSPAPESVSQSAPPQGPPVLGVVPPAGNNLVLDESQIRYCVAESIRIEGAKDLVAMTSEAEYSRFNAMVDDYNSRCSAFRYRRGDLERARAAVEPYRGSLRIEGLRRVSDVQQEEQSEEQPKGQFEEQPTTQARATFLSAPVPQTGGTFLSAPQAQATDALPQRVHAVGADVDAETKERLSQEEKDSLEAACNTDKYVNGPAAYNACLKRQLTLIPAGSHRPDLSGLDQEELVSIEAACNTDKYVNGPAAYNNCLRRNLAALSKATRRPDLSSLSQPERDSIESACNTDKYVNGPAAYNKCLSRQLKRLQQGA